MKKGINLAELLEGEDYYPIQNYSRYVVTKSGKLASINYMRRGFPKILKPWIDKHGYSTFELTSDSGKLKHYRISRILLTTFIGEPPSEDSQARHLDGNPENNKLSNLAWGSPKENQQDRFAHKTDCAGERSPTAKFTEEQVRQIRESSVPARQLAREYGVYHTTILQIRKRKTWKRI